MKHYIFVTMNIGGINGAEQYIYNKMNYLKAQGYRVLIFSGREGKILIDGFREFERLINPALRFYPYCLSSREHDKTVAWIRSEVNMEEGDSCIVESSNVTSALWGEIIAKDLGCRHLAINLSENHDYSQSMRDFLEFKLNRHELSGIFDNSVNKMLNKVEIPFQSDMRVRAYCNNVVQDCGEHYSKLFDKQAEYVFGSIGRLEKACVPSLIKELTKYFSSHTEKRYNLLLIGGCADKRKLNYIKKMVGSCPNVTLVITGELYPIPRELVRKIDLFISAAGSAVVSYYEKVPTVRIHHVTAEPLGILGYDIYLGESVNNQALGNRTLQDCIDQIIEKKLNISYVDNFEKEYYEKMYVEFARQLEFGKDQEEGYYSELMSVRYSALMHKTCSGVCKIFGTRFAYGILEIVRKLVRGFNN